MNNALLKLKVRSIGLWVLAVTLFLSITLVLPGLWFNYINSKSLVLFIGVPLLLFMTVFSVSWAEVKNILRSPVSWGIGVFLFVFALSGIFSIDPTISFFGNPERSTSIFFIFVMVVLWFCASVLPRNTRDQKNFLFAPLVIAGAVVGLSIVIAQSGLVSQDLFLSSKGGGFIGNSSFAGSFFLGSFFLGMYLLLSAKKVWERILWGAMLFATLFNPVFINFTLFHGIKVTQFFDLLGDARGAIITLGLAVPFALGLFIFGKSAKKSLRYSGLALSVIIFGATIFGLCSLVVPSSVVHKFFVAKASATRFVYWDIGLKAFAAHPILGTGPETFRYSYEHYFNTIMMLPENKRELWSDKPHNAYVELLSTTGVVGFFGYVFMIGALLWVIIKRYQKEKNPLFISVGAGFIFAYLLNNFILFDTPTSYVLFFIFCAWLANPANPDLATVASSGEVQPETNKKGGKFFAYVGALLISIIILSNGIPQILKVRRTYFETQSPIVGRPAWYQRVEDTSPYGGSMFLGFRVDIYSQLYQNHIDELTRHNEKDKAVLIADIDAQILAIQNNLKRFYPTTQATNSLARLASIKIALLNKLDPEALAVMKDASLKTIELSPTSPLGYWSLGQAYIYEQKYSITLDLFKQALALEPHLVESYIPIVNLLQITGDKKLLKEYIDQAHQLAPGVSVYGL